MQPIEIVLLTLVCLLTGSIAVGYLWLRFVLSLWADKIAAAEQITLQYREHLAKAAESNNAIVAKLVDLGDKVAAHDMMLKGQPGRR